MPYETDAPLVIDADTVLPPAVALQRFEPVPGGNPQTGPFSSGMQLQELSPCHTFNVLEPGHTLAAEKRLVSRPGSDVAGCAQSSERSARRIAPPIPSVLASDATPRCASMASADRQMIGDATLGVCFMAPVEKSPHGLPARGCRSTRPMRGRGGWAHGPAGAGRWPGARCTETPRPGTTCA